MKTTSAQHIYFGSGSDGVVPGCNTPRRTRPSAVVGIRVDSSDIGNREDITGPVDTPGLAGFAAQVPSDEAATVIAIPMGRVGNAKEIAAAALFLASNESSFLTGSDLMVDGGQAAA